MSDIEMIQKRATKYILSDYSSDYKLRLTRLKLLPLMYIYDLADIILIDLSYSLPTIKSKLKNYFGIFYKEF